MSANNWRRFYTKCGLIILTVIAALMPVHGIAGGADDRYLRPMLETKVHEIGLSIWTELEPRWLVSRSSMNGRIVLTAQTPVSTYPPAAFTFTSFKEMLITAGELKGVAKSVALSARRNFQSFQNEEHFERMNFKSYGSLEGYEIIFEGVANGEEVDVKVFLGQSEAMPPVLLQAYTHRGKLHAISENIRRSWTNIAYIEQGRELNKQLHSHPELISSD